MKTIPTGGAPSAIAVGAGSVWVTNEAGSTVLRISPRRQTPSPRRSTSATGLARSPSASARFGSRTRSTNRLAHRRDHRDAASGCCGSEKGHVTSRSAATRSGSQTNSAAPSRGSTRTRTASFPPPQPAADRPALQLRARPFGRPSDRRAGHTAAEPSPSRTPRTRSTRSTRRSHTVPSSWRILSLTGDGLTAFKRVGGSEGASVVPDLATDLPTPTESGKTYTFHLRRGIRYSTGALVEPTRHPVHVRTRLRARFPSRLLLGHRRRHFLQERTALRPLPRNRRHRRHDRLPSHRARPGVSAEVGPAVRLRRSLLDAAPGRRDTPATGYRPVHNRQL